MIRSRRHFHGFEPLAGIPGNRDALQAGEAAKLGVAGLVWPKQYLSGKMQFEAGLQRATAGAK